MATIQKRVSRKTGRISYRAQVRLRGHPPRYATFARLTDARSWAGRVETEMRAGRHLHEASHTLSDVLDRYEPFAAGQLSRYGDRAGQLRYWRERLGSERLDAITPARVAVERDRLLAARSPRRDRTTGQPAPLSGTTVRAYLAALSAALTYAVCTLQWMEKNPCAAVSKPRPNPGRVRFLSTAELAALLATCRSHGDPSLLLAVTLSLTTGARKSEVMGLRWDQVDFARHLIVLERTKNRERRSIPLVGEAARLLSERAAARHPDDALVFPPAATTPRAPYLCLRAEWNRVRAKAQLADFHWHDLRHTAASYLVMNGVSLVEVAKMLGHRTLQMVARYSHLTDDHIVVTGEKLARRLGIANTTPPEERCAPAQDISTSPRT